MKIQGTVLVQALNKGTTPAADASGKRGEDVERVFLSDTAQFIQSLRETMIDQPEARDELVALARADLESGALGSDADYDRAVDALLSEV